MSGPARKRKARGKRALGVGLSAVAHAAIMVALFAALAPAAKTFDPPAMTVTLVSLPDLTPRLPPHVDTSAAPAKPAPPPPLTARRAPPAPHIQPLPAVDAAAKVPGTGLSDAQIAGAANADGGPPGRGCDMPRRLQSALRKDPLVQAAVAGTAAKAIIVWNGDWVQSGGEDGKGLAAVREAVTWEIAFSPPACRAEPVHGLVLLSMNAGAPRLALGQADWRWSDLLRSPAAPSER